MNNTCPGCHSKMKFIRQINGNFKHSIVIPEWFLNHFRGKISGTISLEAPNGNTYDVGVTENMNRAVIQSGWEAFVDANQIEENYSLMFRYIGISRFEVTIFDSNGMEKTSSCRAGMKTASHVKKPSKYGVDNCSSSHGVTTNWSSADEGSHSDEGQKKNYGKSANMPAASYSSQEFSAEDNPCVDESVEPDDHQTPSNNYVLSSKCDFTSAQEAQIDALVRKIQPEIPLLAVRAKKSSVKGHHELTIRKDYALAYFPHESQTITLQMPKKSKAWLCRFCIRPYRRNHYLKLREFVRGNRVQEGDICLFQPITEVNARRFMVVVHLLPKESINPSIAGKTDVGSMAKMAPTGSVKDEPVTDDEDICSSENEDHDVSDKSEGDYEPPFMLPDRTCLTQAERKKVQAKVNAIDSELPIYVAIMNKTSVYRFQPSCILFFGKRYATGYLGTKSATGRRRDKNSIDLELQVDGHSMSWYTVLQRMSPSTTRIQKGWRFFALDNQLQVRDICLFNLTMKNEKRMKMTVYIIRRDG